MDRIDISASCYAACWGLTDFYPESKKKLEEALASGSDFETEWFGCKKEIRSARYRRSEGKFYIEVSEQMDDLFEQNDLIYDALCEIGHEGCELSEDTINKIRDAAIDSGLGDHTDLTRIIPAEEATYETIIKITEELEQEANDANDAMFRELCDIVSSYVN